MSMTKSKIDTLRSLQLLVAHGFILTQEQQFSLDALRTELSKTEAEVGDDPTTWFVNEASRPQIDGDGNYNDDLKAMCRAEVKEFLEGLVAQYGPLALEIITAAIKRS